MTIFNTVKGTVNTAVDTISTVANTIIEKNRVNAKLNRLRLVMKNESELMNRAYIALGKSFYDSANGGDKISEQEQQKLFEVIESSKKKIAKARECYRKIVDSQNDAFYGVPNEVAPAYDNSKLVDITVACSNESEYDSAPFEDVTNNNLIPESVEVNTEDIATVDNTVKAEKKEKEIDPEIKALVNEADGLLDEDNESPKGELFK